MSPTLLNHGRLAIKFDMARWSVLVFCLMVLHYLW